MNDLISKHLDAIHGGFFGTEITYTAAGVGTDTINGVRFNQPADASGGLTLRQWQNADVVEINAATFTEKFGRDPKNGDTLTIGGETKTVEGARKSDDIGLVWDVDLK